ncbi:gamma-glutamyltranspeptidase [Punctularia strigosozonata HHB-11173 SS5]|uniref:gamma-glutamyltranspeptidase n=1 Tax=Punctularia strigosozonata (strain HHB-11173) TaxID=741275 RepID=UPI000441850A|nr:gamma-glutamyltranspeptidase [Punctularia strigosozonata HHB-11173 SS5]EIN11385.1 gamma-glutamyltranspeptidase [Punctularia strigosozonata HHB-11173 SS5]
MGPSLRRLALRTSVLLTLGAVASANTGVQTFGTSGKHGAVATEVGECSDIGVSILKQGGSAADAIIASGLCVGTIAAYHSGIGGGGFMLVRFEDKHGKGHSYEMIDFRETMPAAGNETMYINTTVAHASTIGGLAVGVPGELRGWEKLHERHGKLPWKTLFQPAIKLAQDGFKVTTDLAVALNANTYPFLLSDPLWAEVYAPNGTLVGLGDTVYRKRYARTLAAIAEHGPDYFYGPHTEIAVNTAEAVHSRGGILTTADLANYSAIIREPVNITYRGTHRIFSTVAPSSGSVVLSALKIFEGYDGSAAPTDPAINLTTHHLIQGTRFGYGQRTNYGDPAFTANVSTLEREFLQESTVEAIRKEISDNQTFPAAYYDINKYIPLNDSGTSHMAAVDRWGNAVSLTTTVNLYWGSQVMTADGVILNDEMDDFSSPGQTNSFGFAAAPVNFIRPGKRPQSSISSSIAEDLETGEFVIATGSAGGSRIITATLQNLYHYLDQGLTPNETVHQSRWHDQLTNVTYFEISAPNLGIAGFSNATVAYLAGLGYNITYEDESGSTAHVIGKKDGVYTAASDPRKTAGRGAAF